MFLEIIKEEDLDTEKTFAFFEEYRAALDGEFNSPADVRRCNDKCVGLCQKLEKLGWAVLSHIIYILERDLLPTGEERVTIEQQFTLYLITLADWQLLKKSKNPNLITTLKPLKRAEAKARIKTPTPTGEQFKLSFTPQDNDFLREAKIKIG